MAKVTLAVIAALAIVCLSNTSSAGEKDDIIARCRKQMGEYGSAMVKACVDQDIEAANSLASYPPNAKPFIVRCQRQMGEYGWALVKACTDQDMEAEKALSGY